MGLVYAGRARLVARLNRLCPQAVGVIQRRLASTKDDLEHSYQASLHLPQTTFANRSNPKAIKELYLDKCSDRLYQWQQSNLPTESRFVLHDGPPYANANVHLGHSVNKVIKDIIIRYQTMRHRQVSYIPGWDCHGLPIELKALEAGAKKGLKKANMTPTEVRALARQHAAMSLEGQKTDFRSWAVMGDWENYYTTMDPAYEIRQLEIFQDMLERGLIFRQRKPVYWSCQSHTALAEAELEYAENHTSTTAYVKFPLVNRGGLAAVLAEAGVDAETPVSALIWTTTPWTIPSNKVIAVNAEMTYRLVAAADAGVLIVADERYEQLRDFFGPTTTLAEGILGSVLASATYVHPLRRPESAPEQPIVVADFVTASSGTGLVHCAPGHGMEDYLLCQKLGVDTYSPVDDYGKYNSDILTELAEELVGKPVLGEGQAIVIDRLAQAGALVKLQKGYRHKYPYDWRSKKPVIVRATSQWFANVASIKRPSTAALEAVNFVPATGKQRMSSFVRERSEWCISRQRSWGVPIPALYDADTGEALMTVESVSHVIAEIKKNGIDSWFADETDVSHWVPPELRGNGRTYVKAKDTLDVWFDSGTSWTLMRDLYGAERAGKPLADVYVEGSDQHRGWFQSSLLTHAASSNTEVAPFANVLTHGFILDETGVKMSKSLGNGILPSQITTTGIKSFKPIGVDGLRLWIAQSEYSRDIAISFVVLQRVAESLSKIRRTFRFILGNISDFGGQYTPLEDLRPVDRYALSQLYELEKAVKDQFDQFAFNRVVQLVNNHISTSLSAFYFTIIKDRVYADATDSVARRSAQTVLAYILRVYVSILSPIVPLMTQEVWDHSPESITGDRTATFSPFVPGWFDAPETWKDEQLVKDFAVVHELQDAVKALMEQARQDKKIGGSLEAAVTLATAAGSDVHTLLTGLGSSWPELFISSDVVVAETKAAPDSPWTYDKAVAVGETTVDVTISKPHLHKCPRCWQYTAPRAEEPCGRCSDVLAQL
ncbi:tRNA synthetases class I-domain-containing protein, partial [Dipodascopsis tothii]|uniref:tRNA synthetases class I-domain-containing protein n=1 Tax=Dipodascopsis tothii TaxID=44089 RepID=UPI0034CDCDD7